MTLENENFVYVRVQGLVWLLNGLVESTNVRLSVGTELSNIYCNKSILLPLIIDFKNIDAVADHTLDDLMNKIIKFRRPIIFTNISSIESVIVPNLPVSENNEQYRNIKDKSLSIALFGSFKTTNFDEVEDLLIKEKFKEIIKTSFVSFVEQKYLSSTPILANGIYDANKIISKSEYFYWVCLKLNDLLSTVLRSNFEIKYPLRLLSVSLRSSAFASVLSQMNKIPLETIDYLGPRHKVFDLDILPNLIDKKRYSYIYIGDFCFGGTEIKIAKTYAQFAQSTFENAIVIGSLLNPKTFETDFDLHCVVQLDGLISDSGAKFNLLEN